jgi:uncharacterized membrane protein
MSGWLWAAAASSACWTFWALFLSAATARMNPIQVTLTSLIAEGLVVLSLVLASGRVSSMLALAEGPTTSAGLAYAAGAGLCGALGLLFYAIAMQQGDAAAVTAVTSAYPVVVAAVSVAVLGERLSPLSSIGIFLSVAGVVLIGLDSRQ